MSYKITITITKAINKIFVLKRYLQLVNKNKVELITIF